MESKIEAAFRILYDEYMADRFTRPRDQETVSDFFTKFIIDREGNVVARFEPTADMAEVEACVKALL